MQTIVRSSPWVARTTAGLSFAVVRSVKGNLTRTTSPGWTLVGVQPFSEPGLSQTHPFSDLKPIRDFREDHLELVRWKLARYLGELFRCDVDHDGLLLHGEFTRGMGTRQLQRRSISPFGPRAQNRLRYVSTRRTCRPSVLSRLRAA